MAHGSFWKITFEVVLALAVAASTAVAGQSDQPTTIDRSAAYRGQKTFRTYCSSCHGQEALGNGPLADDLKVQPANLTELSEKNGGEFPYEMVITTIEHGRSVRGHGTEDMPAWGNAFKMTSETEEEAKAKMSELAHFLWSKQKEE